jgi:hypothetical protein
MSGYVMQFLIKVESPKKKNIYFSAQPQQKPHAHAIEAYDDRGEKTMLHKKLSLEPYCSLMATRVVQVHKLLPNEKEHASLATIFSAGEEHVAKLHNSTTV